MGVSRIQKFKDYRNSLIKEEAPDLETPKSSSNIDIGSDPKESTSTLPIDQVMDKMNETDESLFLKKRKRVRILQYSLVVLGLLLLTAGIIVFAVLVF